MMDEALGEAERQSGQGVMLESAAGKEAPALPPERWIERLRQLRAEGDETAFRQQLAEFRAHYPDYPLPPDLEK
jgi:hypothetical protein